MKNETGDLAYPALFEMDDDGFCTITFPDLPGCISCAENREEGMFLARDALRAWIEANEDLGHVIPEPSSLDDLQNDEGQFLRLIRV